MLVYHVAFQLLLLHALLSTCRGTYVSNAVVLFYGICEVLASPSDSGDVGQQIHPPFSEAVISARDFEFPSLSIRSLWRIATLWIVR